PTPTRPRDGAMPAASRRARAAIQPISRSIARPGRNANTSVYGPRERAGAARAGNPMAGYVAKGIKSRPRVSDVTQDAIDRADANFTEFAKWAGGAVGEWDYTMNHPDARVLHASPNKVHTLSGYIRYTKDHAEISETHGLGVSVYRNNECAPAGGLDNVMLHHDRSNSLER
ncbi:MAG: hypothetical protein ACREEW_15205, partial [Caulobacteraceae bacterium]